jgi:glyoxylase-like metal-dependent hydrolase (beta-lactamase superfamily II)
MDIEELNEPEPIVPGVARALSPLVRRILATNPGPRTGLGTNTYLVGIDEIVVIDPGPADDEHVDSIAGCGGDRIRWVMVTQHDHDHAGAVDALVDRTGAVVLDLADGETILGTEFRLTAFPSPGPADDHRTYLLEEERLLFGGSLLTIDETLTEPTVADPDAVRASIERFSGMRLRRIAPAHGHIIEAAKDAIRDALS